MDLVSTSPQQYNQTQPNTQANAQAIAIAERDEVLSGSESALIVAALCTLVVSILAVSVL
ncbi:MAG: hypothetical protein NXH95_13950 [Pseudomonadaceae bacterium]|nr:hypothetical protein [Pseudomonadaceae bacterium]